MGTTRWDDDALPTWLHTLLTFALVACFALPLCWRGAVALVTRRLEPLMGPDFGVWWFGGRLLEGRAAVAGGVVLLMHAVTFLLLGLAFSRWSLERAWLRRLPWMMLALSIGVEVLMARAL